MKVEEVFKRLKPTKKKLTKKERFADFVFEVGSWVFEARLSAGMTQEKLAKKIDTKQPAIARWETGIQLPTLSSIWNIHLATKLPLPSFEVPVPKSKLE